MPDRPSIAEYIAGAGWRSLEEHIESLPARIDEGVARTAAMRSRLREELLTQRPDLPDRIHRPSAESIALAQHALREGTVAAADGTLAPVPLLGGAKIQVGVVIVSNRGEVVDLVTRVFEADLQAPTESAYEYFTQLRDARAFSNLLSRAIMLYGERRLLLDHAADWRMIHGELIPFELRTGAGRPGANLDAAFELVEGYVETETFIAVSESSNEIDVLNFGILLDPGEYIVVRSLEADLNAFLNGTEGVQRANFVDNDRNRFREFIGRVGPRVSIVLIKAGPRPFLIECHADRVDQAAGLFLADSLWTRGLPAQGSEMAVRGFPFHIDLADQAAGVLFRASDFRRLVEARLFAFGLESGLLDLDPRRTRG